MNIIVLAIDRLHAGYLGPYGNTWVGTPAFNRLAAEGFTFDHVISDCPTLEAFYRAVFTGEHALEPAAANATRLPLQVFADEPLVDAPEMSPTVLVEKPVAQTAASAEETHLATFFSAAIDALGSAPRPLRALLHVASLGRVWDAPLEYRNRYSDTEEALPPEFVEVPRLVLPQHYDPDTLLGYCQAYAGQVGVLDECLAGLLEFLDESALTQDTLLAVTAPRGIALGEHRRIGAWDEVLYGETVHVPLLMRLPDGLGQACRSQALVQPGDLFATFTEWLGQPPVAEQSMLSPRSLLPIIGGEVDVLRDRAAAMSPAGERGIRTAAWYLRKLAGLGVDPDPAVDCQLYTKPDDRWETNDVANRCPEIVELLEQALAEVESGIGAVSMLAPLADVLSSPWR
ncbi:MAG TPA: sulfatase-like hydrolase/transferase [Pirellulales bacterium]|nr:sulfatase-like hydrolase/transferase [Pirellulales bacterium]